MNTAIPADTLGNWARIDGGFFKVKTASSKLLAASVASGNPISYLPITRSSCENLRKIKSAR